MAIKNPLELLLATLTDFEQHASREEKKSAIIPLQTLAKKIKIRSLELLDQRLMLTQAESTRDRETLLALSRFSQHQEIREWATEILNPKPRTPGFLGIAPVRV